MNTKITSLKTRIRLLVLFFMVALILSGITAIPVQTELAAIIPYLSPDGALAQLLSGVLNAVRQINNDFPFLFYGYDWLAFAHIVIAVVFIGVLKDPVRNIWVIEFGMIACAMVIPFALIAGGLRGLPLWWRFIDCSFGVIGFIPLWICRKKIKELEKLSAEDKLNIIF
jgi:hypothetical protein